MNTEPPPASSDDVSGYSSALESDHTSPVVSVVVPVYNKEDHVRAALRSALSQTLQNIEVLVIDDGSDDSSRSLALSIAARDSRVRVVAQENAGVAAARNQGIALARGKFVAFLDPDDWYPDDEVLYDLVEAATRHELPIAGGSAVKFKKGQCTQEYPANESGYVFVEDAILDYSAYQFDYGFWRFLYRRSFLVDNGILFPPYRRFQDPPFFVRAMSLAGKFVALRRPTYVYRVSIETNWKPSRVVDVLRGIVDVLKIAVESDYYDLVNRMIRRFNAPHVQHALHSVLENDDPLGTLPLLETMSRLTAGLGTIWIGDEFLPSRQIELDPSKTSYPVDVSVIVPVHNAAPWLHECLLSVLGQSGASIEVICVNDGSTDDSLRILREYRELDPTRVRVVDQPNGGLSVARNSGLDNATGRYVCFLDSDDYWRLDALSKLVAYADTEDLDILQFDAIPFPDSGVSESAWKQFSGYYNRSQERTAPVPGVDLVTSELSSSDYKPSACLYLARASYLEEIGLRFIPGIAHEDNAFTFSTLLNAKRAAHVTLGFYARRVRANSIMTSASVERSMRGYLVSYLAMHREVLRHSFDVATSQTLGNYLFRVFSNASSRFNQLGEDAVSRVQDLVTAPDAQIAYATLMKNRHRHSAASKK